MLCVFGQLGEFRFSPRDLGRQLIPPRLPCRKLRVRANRSKNARVVRAEMRATQRLAVRLDVAEECCQAIVVFLGNRIEHVVVAAGAAEREPEERRAGRADHFIHFVPRRCILVIGLIVPDTQSIEARGDDRFGSGLVKFVAGQLLGDEPVVGLVGVKRIDDVIAVAPRFRLFRVSFVAVGLSKPRDVEPMSAPALAVFLSR